MVEDPLDDPVDDTPVKPKKQSKPRLPEGPKEEKPKRKYTKKSDKWKTKGKAKAKVAPPAGDGLRAAIKALRAHANQLKAKLATIEAAIERAKKG